MFNTGVGYYYQNLSGKSHDDRDSTKVLSGAHDCRAEHSRFGMPLYVLEATHDSVTGRTTLIAGNRVHLCQGEGLIRPEHMDSFRAHMSEFVNSDDPKIAKEIRRAHELDRGELSVDLLCLSSDHAKKWIMDGGFSCTDFTRQGQKYVSSVLDSKHIQPEITEDNVSKGIEVSFLDIDDDLKMTPGAKEAIRTTVREAMDPIVPHRPKGTTVAQWSQALSTAAQDLCQQMLMEEFHTQISTKKLAPEADDEWHCKAMASIVDAPRQRPSRVDTMRPISGYIETYGELRRSDVEKSFYRRTPEYQSRWIPIERVKGDEL